MAEMPDIMSIVVAAISQNGYWISKNKIVPGF
jgi:hypothetical protein